LTATRLASLEARSGKIMRRLLRDIAEGRALGDTPTLADPTVVATLKEKYESEE
jgi:acetyl-CoA synthetase